MKLFGRYNYERLVQAIQGQFSCTYDVKTNRATLFVFSLKFVIGGKDQRVVSVYRMVGDAPIHLITIKGDSNDT